MSVHQGLALESVLDVTFPVFNASFAFNRVYWIKDFLLGQRNRSCSFIDIPGCTIPHSFLRPLRHCRCIGVSRNSNFLVSSSRSDLITVFNLNKQLSFTLPPYNQTQASFCGILFGPRSCNTTFLAVSNDGQLTASVSVQGLVQVFIVTDRAHNWVQLQQKICFPCFSISFSRVISEGAVLTIVQSDCKIINENFELTIVVTRVYFFGTNPVLVRNELGLPFIETTRTIKFNFQSNFLTSDFKNFGSRISCFSSLDQSNLLCTITTSNGLVLSFPPSIINDDVINPNENDCLTIDSSNFIHVGNSFVYNGFLLSFLPEISLEDPIIDFCFTSSGLTHCFTLASGMIFFTSRGHVLLEISISGRLEFFHKLFNPRKPHLLYPFSYHSEDFLLISDGFTANAVKLPKLDLIKITESLVNYNWSISLFERVKELWIYSTSCFSSLRNREVLSKISGQFFEKTLTSGSISRVIFELLNFDRVNQIMIITSPIIFSMLQSLLPQSELFSKLNSVYNLFLKDRSKCTFKIPEILSKSMINELKSKPNDKKSIEMFLVGDFSSFNHLNFLTEIFDLLITGDSKILQIVSKADSLVDSQISDFSRLQNPLHESIISFLTCYTSFISLLRINSNSLNSKEILLSPPLLISSLRIPTKVPVSRYLEIITSTSDSIIWKYNIVALNVLNSVYLLSFLPPRGFISSLVKQLPKFSDSPQQINNYLYELFENLLKLKLEFVVSEILFKINFSDKVINHLSPLISDLFTSLWIQFRNFCKKISFISFLKFSDKFSNRSSKNLFESSVSTDESNQLFSIFERMGCLLVKFYNKISCEMALSHFGKIMWLFNLSERLVTVIGEDSLSLDDISTNHFDFRSCLLILSHLLMFTDLFEDIFGLFLSILRFLPRPWFTSLQSKLIVPNCPLCFTCCPAMYKPQLSGLFPDLPSHQSSCEFKGKFDYFNYETSKSFKRTLNTVFRQLRDKFLPATPMIRLPSRSIKKQTVKINQLISDLFSEIPEFKQDIEDASDSDHVSNSNLELKFSRKTSLPNSPYSNTRSFEQLPVIGEDIVLEAIKNSEPDHVSSEEVLAQIAFEVFCNAKKQSKLMDQSKFSRSRVLNTLQKKGYSVDVTTGSSTTKKQSNLMDQPNLTPVQNSQQKSMEPVKISKRKPRLLPKEEVFHGIANINQKALEIKSSSEYKELENSCPKQTIPKKTNTNKKTEPLLTTSVVPTKTLPTPNHLLPSRRINFDLNDLVASNLPTINVPISPSWSTFTGIKLGNKILSPEHVIYQEGIQLVDQAQNLLNTVHLKFDNKVEI
ncbi:hypothetical protein RCL1_001679 [Eukaryota sp. TZLM3-RCL]